MFWQLLCLIFNFHQIKFRSFKPFLYFFHCMNSNIVWMKGGCYLCKITFHFMNFWKHLTQIFLLEKILKLRNSFLQNPMWFWTIDLENSNIKFEWDWGKLVFIKLNFFFIQSEKLFSLIPFWFTFDFWLLNKDLLFCSQLNERHERAEV